jgi:nicotinamidase-related amidase
MDTLVVIDMQRDFITGALGTKEARAIVDNVVNKINSFDGQIVVTLDTHQDNYLDTQEGKKLPIPHCIEQTDGWLLNNKIREALKNKENVAFIKKEAFGSGSLPYKIFYGDGDRTIIVGVCTDICVVSNALLLKAILPEAEIIVDASCCAGTTPEKHLAALEVMKSCQIDIIGE